MPWFEFFWASEIEAHLAEHGVSPDEFEEVVSDPSWTGVSRTKPRLLAEGHTSTGRYIRCVYELEKDGITVVPVTAFNVRER